jgi:4-amino-4-deoxy-L-arabinose transferase-like glycosyltransferase
MCSGGFLVKKIILLLVLSYFFLMFGNGLFSLSNPDEVFYALTAKEMNIKNVWMTPYIFDYPQFEKPIFTYWLLKIAFLGFGVSSFSARFFPAVFGIIGVLAVYWFGIVTFKDTKKAFMCSLITMSSILYAGLSRIVLTDMIFTVFILLALVSFVWGYLNRNKKNISIILFYVFCAFAVLTKGPLGFGLPFLVVVLFLLIQKDIKYILCGYSLVGFIAMLAISVPWYVLMIKKYGQSFNHEFFYNDHWRRVIEAEHKSHDKWYIYPGYILVGVFPWTLYFIPAFISLFKNIKKKTNPVYVFLACWIGVIFVVFQAAHSKLVSYILPLYPALYVLTGDYIDNIITNEKYKKSLFNISIINYFVLCFIPVGVIFAVAKGYGNIAYKLPFYIAAFVLMTLMLVYLILVARKSFLKSIYVLSLLVMVILGTIPFAKRDLEISLTSEKAARYLIENYKIDNLILTSKFYARGVRYYTDKGVAVVNIGGKNYFSPHPMPYLDSEEKVKDFFEKQKVTYCVVYKEYVEEISKIAGDNELSCETLKVIGDDYILRVQAKV